MPVNSSKKKIIVLSDNNGLSRAIELNLHSHLEADVVKVASSLPKEQDSSPKGQEGSPNSRGSQIPGDCNLIIVAASSPTSEPVVTLARASLVEQIGQVPLLIISDRPFQSEPGEQIVHLDFPFDIDELHHKVKEILNRKRDLPSGRA